MSKFVTPGHRQCRLCHASLTTSVVDLGMSPLCESILKADQLDDMEPYFPLHVLLCGDCFLVQLQEYVKPEHIFTEYGYFSSYSTSWVEHARQYCGMITGRLGLAAEEPSLRDSSNDGYLLQHFLPLGISVTGIEPAANVADAARRKNIPTLVEFLRSEAGASASDLRGKPPPHHRQQRVGAGPRSQRLHSWNGASARPNGVITLEFPHLERLIVENQFDTILP